MSTTNTDMRNIMTNLENGYETDRNNDTLTENDLTGERKFTIIDVEKVIDIYRKGMWEYGEPFINRFPELDDDVLADAISDYIVATNGEYDIDLWRQLYAMIEQKYKIFG